MIIWLWGSVVIVVVALVGSWMRARGSDRLLTQPMGAIATLYTTFLLLYVALIASSLYNGSGGGGPSGSVCVTTFLESQRPADPGETARAGAAISAVGHIQACALHPGFLQWVLFLLTKLPSIVLWGSVLLVIIRRLIRQAAHGGPFTAQVAATMRQLGWLVIVGNVIVAALGAIGADVLARMLMTPAPFDGGYVVLNVLVTAPLQALVPVPLLAGAILLTFARIIRVGAVLDEEVKATV